MGVEEMKLSIETPSGEVIELDEETSRMIFSLAEKEGVSPKTYLMRLVDAELLTIESLAKATRPHVDKMTEWLLKGKKR